VGPKIKLNDNRHDQGQTEETKWREDTRMRNEKNWIQIQEKNGVEE
jgi:hypothetical protein